jgi:hypothetical protein
MNLFAGVGPTGEMRFIGEVARGAACACRCPECGSPLIAKQGAENEWHFAHEAGQERPECAAGAINMLRRFAVEYLQHLKPLMLPPYRVAVRSSSQAGGGRSEIVEWAAQFLNPLVWFPCGPRNSAVARGALDTKVEAELFVEIEGQHGQVAAVRRDQLATISFVCSLPPPADLRDRLRAERHIRQHGRLEWRHHPDNAGRVAAAEDRVRKLWNEDIARAKAQAAERTLDAGKRRAQFGQQLDQEYEARPVQHTSTPRSTSAESVAWAPDRKPGASFIFYRLKDGSSWVVYTLQDDSIAIAPWVKEEGWDEMLPSSVAVVDTGLGVYRGKALSAVMIFFGARTERTLATTDPRELERIAGAQ